MSKNIILCSDGTGNSGGKSRGTNVWRTFNAIDRFHDDVEQVTFYDDGVGTSDFKLPKTLGGAFGWGLSRNICQLYASLVNSYDSGDRLFLFGFSRGAFTVRSLAGLIGHCGIVDRTDLSSEQIMEAVDEAFAAYKSRDVEKMAAFRKKRSMGPDIQEVYFVGVWDTVNALAVPFDSLRSILDMFFNINFHLHDLGPHIVNAYHALAIDDERRSFHPTLFDESLKTKEQNVEQVWFAGMHSNVGGGYARDEVAKVALDWMMAKASEKGLHFEPGVESSVSHDANAQGKLYDSRSGLAAFYRYRPRPIAELCQMAKAELKVHLSALDRIAWATNGYAPHNVQSAPRVISHSDRDTAHVKRVEKKLKDDQEGRKEALSSLGKIVFGRKVLYWLLLIFAYAIAASAITMLRTPPSINGLVYVYQEEEGTWQFKSHFEFDGAQATGQDTAEQDTAEETPSRPPAAKELVGSIKDGSIKDGLHGQHFGQALALAGDLAVLGEPIKEGHDESGRVYIFRRTDAEGKSWQTVAALTAPEDGIAEFGRTVALNGDMLMIGARRAMDPGPRWLQLVTKIAVWMAPDALDNLVRSLFRSAHWVLLAALGLSLLYYLRNRLHVRMRRLSLDAWRGAVPRRLGTTSTVKPQSE